MAAPYPKGWAYSNLILMINYTLIHLWFFILTFPSLPYFPSSCNHKNKYFSIWIQSGLSTWALSRVMWKKKSALRTTVFENLIIISMGNYNKWLVWNTHRIGTETNHSNLSPLHPPHTLGSSALLPMTVEDVFWLRDSIVTQVMRSVKDAFPWDGKKQLI